MDDHSTYQALTDHVRQTKLLGSIQALLEWDQQTYLPPGGTHYRADQVGWLAGQIHQRETDERLGDWLGTLLESPLALDPHSDTGSTIHELNHRFRKKSRLPLDLVQSQAKLHSLGQREWVAARKDDDFSAFSKTLNEIFHLKREEAQAGGTTACLYDALLDDYEPGAETQQVRRTLEELRDALVPLIAAAAEYPTSEHQDPLTGDYPVTEQRQFAEMAIRAIGFDLQRGRLDVAAHPFCTEAGPDDCRITTRFDESWFSMAFFGCLHEAGHGLYEQGLRQDQYGLPPGQYCSLGLHESQSRLWENLVGRSRGFWRHFFPQAKVRFPTALRDCDQPSFFRAINQIAPSLIRVEADEATYNLHIIIRFELEQALLEDQLPIADLPAAWNEKYQQYLGITPDTDTQGVLQDVHWSAGLVGYFPTYSLGNIYASMLFDQAESELGQLEPLFAAGNFSVLLEWLRQKVHQKGLRYRAHELMKQITGNTIDHNPLVSHLRQKVKAIDPARSIDR